MELRETARDKRSTAGKFSAKRKTARTTPDAISKSTSAPSAVVVESIHQAFMHKLAGRAIIIVGFFLLALVVLYTARATGLMEPERMQSFVQASGIWGPLALIAIVTFTSMSITVPSTPVIILAGAVYGTKLATLYCLIGVFIGASIAFWIARFFRKPIITMIGEHAKILERFQQRYVMMVLFVTRVIPIFSFEVMSYAAGLTSITYGQFLLATLGTLGSVFVLTSVGSVGASFGFGDGGGLVPLFTAALMVLMLFVVPLAIDHYNPFGWKEKLLMPKESEH